MRGKPVEGKPEKPGEQRREARPTRPGQTSVSKGPSRSRGRFARAASQVRIIGGLWKRTLLPVADAPGLRPSPDRVRETVFNWLGHFIPDLRESRGLDLFAGTGALGFELASRGAGGVTLVEQNAALVAELRRTREKLAAEAVTVVAGEALAYARSVPDASFDVIFLDPPFEADLLAPSMKEAARLLAPDGLVYAESGVPLAPADAAGCGLQIVRAGRAGHVHFHLLQKA